MAITLEQMKAQFADPLRQGVVDLLWKNSRIMQRLHFIQNAGLSYQYAANAKLPGVGFRSLNGTFTATEGIINPLIETLSILGGKMRTDGVLIKIKGDGVR